MPFQYPSTPHLPFSLGISSSDRIIKTLKRLENQEIVVLVKYDGDNVSLTRDSFLPRNGKPEHPSRQWVREFYKTIKHLIPPDLQICGENLQAKHHLRYDNLPSYFLGHSAWKGETSLSWDNTLILFRSLGIVPVRQVYRGFFDLELLEILGRRLDPNKHEGFVVRTCGQIPLGSFDSLVCKYVRAGHYQADVWCKKSFVPNGPLAK